MGARAPVEAKTASRKAELKRLLNLCEDLEVRAPDRIVLAAIWAHADDEGWCYPSVGTLAVLSGLTERRVRTSLLTLGGLGLVPSIKATRSGQLTSGVTKLRRGQSLFLVWPLATERARVRFLSLRPGPNFSPPSEESFWWFGDKDGPVHGPYDEQQMVSLIAGGTVTPTTLVQTSTGAPPPSPRLLPIVRVPALAELLPLLPQ